MSFGPEAVAFLHALAANNDRNWFAAHRAEYEGHLVAPMRALVTALAPTVLAVDPDLDVRPRVGGAISRIHRDTRFSRDKSPYRASAWLAFRRPGPGWPSRPALFFEIGQEGWRCGMGYYAARPATMARLRRLILAREEEFRAALTAAGAAGLRAEGPRYARPPRDAPPREGVIGEWLHRRSVYLVRSRPHDDTLSDSGLVTLLGDAFAASAALYRLMRAAG